MAHRNWKWENKVIYKPVRKMSELDTNIKIESILQHDGMQCKTEETNTLGTQFSNQNYFEKWFKT